MPDFRTEHDAATVVQVAAKDEPPCTEYADAKPTKSATGRRTCCIQLYGKGRSGVETKNAGVYVLAFFSNLPTLSFLDFNTLSEGISAGVEGSTGVIAHAFRNWSDFHPANGRSVTKTRNKRSESTFTTRARIAAPLVFPSGRIGTKRNAFPASPSRLQKKEAERQ